MIERVLRQVLTACCLVLAAAGGARAQSSTTGAINGIVRDADSSEPLAGVTVVATSPNLQGAQSTMTGAGGAYKIDNLPPGTYLVTFYYSAARVARRDIRVGLTRVTRVDQRIDVEAGGGEVIVVDARAPSIDITRTDEGTAVDEEYLEHMPLPGRTFEAALGVAAGASRDYRGLGFSGSTSLENSYVIDGVNTTGLRDGLGGTSLLNEFIDEIRILTGGYQAEFGRATGAVVNVITKSGTNEFHGSVFSTIKPYVRPRGVIVNEASVIDTDAKTDYLLDFGFELGGPIVKDRVWFYVGFAPRLQRETVTRYVRSRRDCQEPTGDGELTECTPAHQDGLPDVDPHTGFLLFDEVEHTERHNDVQQYQFVTKLNFAVDADHQGTLSVLGAPTSGEVGGGASAEATVTHVTRLDTDVAARWTSKLYDNRTQVEALFGWHRGKYDRRPIYETLDDVQRIEVRWSNLGTYGRAGGESERVVDACTDGDAARDPYPLIQNCPIDWYPMYAPGELEDDLDERKVGSLEVTQRVDLGGHHELKTGVEVEDNLVARVRRYTGGQFNVHVPAAGINHIERYATANGEPGPDVCGFERTAAGALDLDNPIACTYLDASPSRTNVFNWVGFLQDSWSLRSNLTLNYGVRYEEQRVRYAEEIRNTVDPLTGEPLGTNALVLRNMWAPRAGLVYDWTKEGRSKIYGSVGRFYESIPMAISMFSLSGAGNYWAEWDFAQCAGNDVRWDGDPSLAAAHPGNCPRRVTADDVPAEDSLYWGGVSLVTPGTKAQYLDEMNLGVQYELFEDLRLGAVVRRRSLGRVIEDVSTDDLQSIVIGNPGPNGFDAGEERALEERIAELPEGDPERERLETRLEQYRGLRQFDEPRRDYTAIELTAVKRFSHDYFVQASYTLSALRGNYPGSLDGDTFQEAPHISSEYDVVELMPNRDGPLPHDRTHQLKLDGYHTWDLGAGGLVTAGARFRAFSGTPVNAFGPGPLFGLNESVLLPRGSFGRTEFVTSTDLHVGYGRRLANGYELHVFADILNLFNQDQATIVDQSYTHDYAYPIVGGSRDDLVYLKRGAVDGVPPGVPVTRNRNFGNPWARWESQSFRFGARLSF